MEKLLGRIKNNLRNPQSGMELVEVAIIIGVVVVLGLVFKTKISAFVKTILNSLNAADFT
ncbi:MAG: hypothetical protein MJ148_00950 [Clostridia bacterium]|nr:hypothetical protein [Clostridia bacterium]